MVHFRLSVTSCAGRIKAAWARLSHFISCRCQSKEMRDWRVSKNRLGKGTLESDTIPVLVSLAWTREQWYLKEAEKYSSSPKAQSLAYKIPGSSTVWPTWCFSHVSPSTQNCSKFDKKFKMTTQKSKKYIQLHSHISLLLLLKLPSCNTRNGQEIGDKVKWRVENAGRDSMRHRLNVSEYRDTHL